MPLLRGKQALLLPARKSFVWRTLLSVVVFDMLLPMNMRYVPDFVLLVYVFWTVREPGLMGVVTGFVLGLWMDIRSGGSLGHHALAYSVTGYLAVLLSRRIQVLPVWQQMLGVVPLMYVHAIILLILGVNNVRWVAAFEYHLSPLLTALLWPVAVVVLLAPQRRPTADIDTPI